MFARRTRLLMGPHGLMQYGSRGALRTGTVLESYGEVAHGGHDLGFSKTVMAES
jgi:hypothetical protein